MKNRSHLQRPLFATFLLLFLPQLLALPQGQAKDPLKEKPALKKPSAPVQKSKKPKETPVSVKIETSMGAIVVQLDAEKAPISVKNFLNYVKRKFYDDLVFHRVIDNFMIQGGGFDKKLSLRPTDASIKNEANNGLKNLKGTIAMARTPDPDSASSQFFINLKDNAFLNYQGPLPRDYGYAVFGQVIEGMDVVEKIGKVKTKASGQMRDVPVEPVVIKSIREIKPEENKIPNGV